MKGKNVFPQKKKKTTNLGARAAAWFQWGTRFGQWRIRRWRIIQACSWKSLSRNIAFFCFLGSHYFFLTDCWYIQRWTSCFAFWELIEPRALVTFSYFRRDFAFYQDEIHRFSCLVVALFCFLSKDFSPFWSVSWQRNEMVSKAWPRLLNVNKCYGFEIGSLPLEKSLGSQWLMRIMTPWRFISFQYIDLAKRKSGATGPCCSKPD